MHDPHVRRLIVAVVALTACGDGGDALEGPEDPVAGAEAFVADARVRRRALEASVAVADTAYGRLRLEHYSLSGAGIDDPEADWDSTPVLEIAAVRRPRVATPGEPDPAPLDEGPVADLSMLDTLAGWEAAGREAFARYPIQVDPRFGALLDDADGARDFGLAVAADGTVAGVVEVLTPAGDWAVAISCAFCHSAPDGEGGVVAGLTNSALRYGDLLFSPWPPGTMDVTPDGIDNPVRPSDLRPIARQARLHHAGNLANGRLARMVRIETLIATQLGFSARPDRRLVAALSLYLDSLASGLPAPRADHPGRSAFDSHCRGCHEGGALAGAVVPLSRVGTDGAATIDSTRATGGYRATSLLGAADRGTVLHDASASGLRGLLRLQDSAHAGHPFGLELSEAEREAIVGYLRGD